MENRLQYATQIIPLRLPEAGCKPWPHKRHCRRRFHNAFFRWYAARETTFAIRLELLRRTDQSLEIGFCNIDRIVTAYVGDDEIGIAIDWRDTNWDVLQWFDASPRRVPGGYVCDRCPEDNRPTYPTREAIWRIEIFEAFLSWVNDDLANADAVAVSGDPERGTWARLIRPER